MVQLALERNALTETTADVLVQFMFEDRDLFRAQKRNLEHLTGLPAAPFASGAFSGKAHQTLVVYPRACRAKILVLVGMGKAADCSPEKLRRAAAASAKAAETLRARTLAIMEPDPKILTDDPEAVALALAEGAVLSLYRYDKYLPTERKKDATLTKVTLVTGSRNRIAGMNRGVKLARILCESTYLARDLANAPGNELYPDSLARRTVKVGGACGIRVTVFDEKKIRGLKMGGLLGVSRGSARAPRFLVMEHNRRSKRGTVVLVGKGVTFDAGGISLKPAANMAEMKMDMSGAGAVIGTLQAAALLNIPLHLVGLIPAAENLPGGRALKPGDILTHYNGKTSEIDNTDAEGRLILADALAYAEKFGPDLVIDLATLTGSCVVALGHIVSGMMGNDKAMMARLKESGERTYERVWPLPMFDEYEKLIKSDVATVKNTGGRWAGVITAAMFLKTFIGKYKWIHLDIAGPAIMEESSEYLPKGGSGVGVRLLVDFLLHWNRG